jgi:hypothetical protein
MLFQNPASKLTIYVTKSEDFPDIAEAWSMTATGFCFTDTYQAIARKALRHLCQLYEEPITRTPMRFFPPLEKNRPAWIARMEALQEQEDYPTMKFMTDYLLSLDEQYDRQAAGLMNCIHRAHVAVIYARSLHVEAQARVTADRQEPVILEGIPIHLPGRRRTDPALPPAPPPSRDFDAEPLLPLTQPLPNEEPAPSSVEEPPARRNEASLSDEVD